MGPNPASETRKVHKAPERRIELLELPSPSTDGWFAVRISLIAATRRHFRTKSTVYLVREIPADGMGKCYRGFEVEKLDEVLNPTGEVYHVLVDPRDDYRHCDCVGCEKWSHCKHADGLAALCKAGKVKPRYRSAGDMAANDPLAFDRHMASLAGFGGEPADEIYPFARAEAEAPWEGPNPAA